MATLDGSSRQVNLGQGIAVRAPGLRGQAEAHNVAPGSDTRAPEVDGSGDALDAALTQEGFLRLRVITLDVAPVPHATTGELRAPVSDVPGLGLARGVDGHVHLAQDAAGGVVEHAAGVGEAHVPGVAIEEARAHRLLELADLHAERRLGDGEASGGASEVQLVHHLTEIAQVAELEAGRVDH